SRMFEPGCGGNHRVIDDRVAEYLTGSRATKDGSPFEVSAQVAYEFTRLYQRSGAENEHHSWSFDFPRRQTRLPPVSLGPFVLCCFHEVSPSSFNRKNRERCVNCFTLARNRSSPMQPHSVDRIVHDSYFRRTGHDLTSKLKLFCGQSANIRHDACYIPTWMGIRFDQAKGNRIAQGWYDNGDR